MTNMDMLSRDQIAQAELIDWRKLGQGLHARFRVDDYGAAARFAVAIGAAGDEVKHHPKTAIGPGYIDLKLSSDEAIYRDDDGTEHVVEWVTQQDVELARRISALAAEHHLTADPSAVSHVELGLDTTDSATIAPVWAALLTGDPTSQGRGTPGDEIRDAGGRVPNLWFGDGTDEQHRFHLEVYVAPEVAAQRIEAAVAAGATVVDDSESPGVTVLADQDGNRAVLCVAAAPLES